MGADSGEDKEDGMHDGDDGKVNKARRQLSEDEMGVLALVPRRVRAKLPDNGDVHRHACGWCM